jgi:hypothetical protein
VSRCAQPQPLALYEAQTYSPTRACCAVVASL